MRPSSRSDRIPALVVGSGTLALGAIRVFGRQGIPSFAAAPRPGLERVSRWYRPVPGRWRGDDLATDLTSCGVDQAVLIPTSERDAIRAAELPRGLASRFPSSAPSADLLRSFGDKERQVELLRRHGVPVPKSWPAAALHDPSSLSEDEIAALVDQAVSEVGAESRKDMGAVMKLLQERTAGRADNKVLSQMVMSRLS